MSDIKIPTMYDMINYMVAKQLAKGKKTEVIVMHPNTWDRMLTEMSMFKIHPEKQENISNIKINGIRVFRSIDVKEDYYEFLSEQ